MEIGIFPTIAGNDFFFNFLGLSGTPKSPATFRRRVDRKKKDFP